MIVASAAAGANASGLKLTEVYNRMDAAGVTRLSILDSSGAVSYIIHEPTLDSFARTLNIAQAGLLEDKKIQNLSMELQCGQLVKSMGWRETT